MKYSELNLFELMLMYESDEVCTECAADSQMAYFELEGICA